MNHKAFSTYRPLFVSLSLYIASLALPAFILEHHSPATGLDVLLIGWLGVLRLNLAWWANPTYLAATVFFVSRSYQRSTWLCLFAFLVSWQSFAAIGYPLDESGLFPITQVVLGFYVWVASFAVLGVSSALRYRQAVSA